MGRGGEYNLIFVKGRGGELDGDGNIILSSAPFM